MAGLVASTVVETEKEGCIGHGFATNEERVGYFAPRGLAARWHQSDGCSASAAVFRAVISQRRLTGRVSPVRVGSLGSSRHGILELASRRSAGQSGYGLALLPLRLAAGLVSRMDHAGVSGGQSMSA